VAQSLDQSHTVTALVRDPERLKNRKDKFHVRAGDVLDERVLASAMAGQEVVISTLGVGNSLKSNALIGRSVPVILTVMSNQSVRRLIFVSAYGVGNTREYADLGLT
jgi:putative NADH-flavin reductase